MTGQAGVAILTPRSFSIFNQAGKHLQTFLLNKYNLCTTFTIARMSLGELFLKDQFPKNFDRACTDLAVCTWPAFTAYWPPKQLGGFGN